jgi:hypothetical protein
MTAAEAFEKWWSQRNPGLPWESDRETAAEAFGAGWGAHESLASVAQLAEQPVCSGPVAGSTPAASSKHEGKWVDGLKSHAEEISEILAEANRPTPEDIYAAYPRKVGKRAALKAIEKAMRVSDRSPLGMLRQTRAYAAAVAQWPEAEKQYIPHPATWFNRGSYEDDPNEWQRGTSTTSQFRIHH